ncbi:thiamine diphosphokinase [Litorilinea aerophila]|uniref:Thiamine diphosphokinase n=1 Tax=Litorilinea aerophila TaxID=1204385 RepID=A0A540VLL5_9CHLR|nr:thiamine diphosphokinase [Litorilinea aerophila]MCC9074865.1 thiamine diphosphokinase [Litorilinea aerophila]OUC05365.1 hypothetical protein RY27_27735 [Litorilinea aerophila]GIV77808.1 MAG: thiamine pyrophosphokinase [Litorilinea sp.]
MRGVIMINGRVEDYGRLRGWLRPDDLLIAADGGTAHCLALGRRPDIVVGDMDSVDPEVVAELARQGTRFERHPVAKDETDLELAIQRALREGVDEILLLAALGGRLDQTLANVLILAQRPWPVPVRLADGDQLATLLRDGETLVLDGPVGSLVSVLPLSASVTGITYQGLAYPLHNATLHLGSTRGISNQVASLPASIQIERGLLLVVQSGVET